MVEARNVNTRTKQQIEPAQTEGRGAFNRTEESNNNNTTLDINQSESMTEWSNRRKTLYNDIIKEILEAFGVE